MCVCKSEHCRLYSWKIIMSFLFITDVGPHPKTVVTVDVVDICTRIQQQFVEWCYKTALRFKLLHTVQAHTHMQGLFPAHIPLLASQVGRWIRNKVVFISRCVTSRVPRASSSQQRCSVNLQSFYLQDEVSSYLQGHK